MYNSPEETLTRLRALLPELQSRFKVARIGLYGIRASLMYDSGIQPSFLVECSEPLGTEFLIMRDWLVEQFGIPLNIHTSGMLKPRKLEEAKASVRYA